LELAAHAVEFIAETKAGNENFDRMRGELQGTEIEEVGKDLRDMMPWVDQEF